MATKDNKPSRYETWTQVAFSKAWDGCPTVGIVQRERFYAIPNAAVGQVVRLRRLNKLDAVTPEWSLDGARWTFLTGGRPI